jgi:hypothetical protein
MLQDNMQPGQELIREAKAEGLLLIATVSVYVLLSSSSGLTSSFMSSFMVKYHGNHHYKRMAYPAIVNFFHIS